MLEMPKIWQLGVYHSIMMRLRKVILNGRNEYSTVKVGYRLSLIPETPIKDRKLNLDKKLYP